MRKIFRTHGLVIMTALVLTLSGCGEKQESENVMAKEHEYPQIAYIDNVSYYGTGEICETVPRKMPDGFIETFVSEEIMPDAYNSANFASDQEKLEYIFLDDGQLIIHIGESWYYFEEKTE